jgi:hypothetical protein
LGVNGVRVLGLRCFGPFLGSTSGGQSNAGENA